MESTQQDLRHVIETLLAVCDGAVTIDGQGFNKFDGFFARSVIEQDHWTQKQVAAIYKMLIKYQSQLLGFGIDIKALKPKELDEAQPEAQPDETPKTQTIEEYFKSIPFNEAVEVETKYGKKMLSTSTAFPKDFWDMWNKHKDEIKSLGYSVYKDRTGKWEIQKWGEIQKQTKSEKPVVTEVTLQHSHLLLEYQIPHVKGLIRSIQMHDACLDASDTGTGKTFAALVIAKELNLFPIVLTPKSVVPGFDKIRRKHFEINGFVSNYEQYKFEKTPYLVKDINPQTGKRAWKWNVPENALLIFDEAHRTKDYKTQNAEMLVQAKKQGIKIMVMSATIADNPLQMYATGLTIGLFTSIKGYFNWIRQNGCYQGAYGWEFDGSKESLRSIHDAIFPNKGARINKTTLGDMFPKNRILADVYDMGKNSTAIQKAYEEMEMQLTDLHNKQKGDKSHHLVAMIRARQKVELLKVPTLVEMTQDLIEEGNSVAIFVNFDETVTTLAEKLETKCIIWGGNKGEEREDNRVRFQEGKERIVICNIKAGGVGISLHDEFGNFPRVSLICPSWSAQDLVQALGRIDRAGSKSAALQKIVFCANTIEEDIADKVQEKIGNIQTLNDGDVTGIYNN